jgi:hypothetical protein
MATREMALKKNSPIGQYGCLICLIQENRFGMILSLGECPLPAWKV